MKPAQPSFGDVPLPEALVAAMGIEAFLVAKPRLTGAVQRKATDMQRLIERDIFRAIRNDEADPVRASPFDFQTINKALIETGSDEQLKAFEDAFAGLDSGLIAAVQATATRIIHALQDARPARASTGIVAEPTRPSDVEIYRFERLFRVADDPFVLIEALAHNRMTRDQARNCEAFYPNVYEAMRKGVVLAISRVKAQRAKWQPPRAKELQLRVLMQADALTPQLAAELSAASPEPAPQLGPRAVDLGGLSEALKTTGQKVSAK